MGNTIKGIIAAAGAALACYLGTLTVPIVVLVSVMILDYITGMTKAWITRTLSSGLGVIGIAKKVGYLCVVAVAMVADWLIGEGLSAAGVKSVTPVFVCILVTVWLIINELISILENLGEIGVPLPAFFIKLIKRLKTSVEQKGDAAADGENSPQGDEKENVE